ARLPDRPPLGRALRARAPAPAGRRELARARDARHRPRPDLRRPRGGRGARRRRRQPLRRLRVLVGPAHPRPRPPGDPRGHHRHRREGHHVRRADRDGGRPGRRGRPPHAVRADAADDLLGHGGGDERRPPGAGRHGARQAPEVLRRLPRPPGRPPRRRGIRAGHRVAALVPRRAGGGDGQHGDRALERRGGRGGRVRPARVRGDPGRAVPGQHGPRPAARGLPRAPA
ncbi:MAG: Glutamate-1-semialdehyde 2,1-aminomutase, partial [uncultured Gemmatimonadaceae bacterium]